MSDEYIKMLLNRLDNISKKISDLGMTLFWTNVILAVLILIFMATWLK